MEDKTKLTTMVVDIVAAYVGNNPVPPSELPSLISNIHQSLTRLSQPLEITTEAAKSPAVSIKKSVTPNFIICLEDGRQFKSLKRHLTSKYNLTPDAYRAKWGLPKDYPMVAPNYAATRSNLAKQMGLGQGGRQLPKRGGKAS